MVVKAVAKRDKGAVAKGYAQYAIRGQAAGAEGITSDDLVIPRLYMLQPLSPQIVKDDRKIKNAKPGMILNTVDNSVYSRLFMVMVKYRRTWVEWVDRKNGGGFVKEHLEANPKWTREERGPYRVPGTAPKKGALENLVNDTRSFFCLYSEKMEKGVLVRPQAAILSGTSTQIRRFAALLTVLTSKELPVQGEMFRMPIFASIVEVTSEKQQNEDGVWYSWVFRDTGELVPEASALLQEAGQMKRMADQLQITAGAPPQEEHAQGESM